MLDRWEMDKYGIIGATIDEQGRIKPHKPVRAMKDSILVLRVQVGGLGLGEGESELTHVGFVSEEEH